MSEITVSGFRYAIVEMGRRNPMVLEVKDIQVDGECLIIWDQLGDRVWVHASRVVLSDKMP